MVITSALMTIAQVCEFLKISERKVWAMVSTKGIPQPLRIGGGKRAMVRWRRSDLEAWVESGCVAQNLPN